MSIKGGFGVGVMQHCTLTDITTWIRVFKFTIPGKKYLLYKKKK